MKENINIAANAVGKACLVLLAKVKAFLAEFCSDVVHKPLHSVKFLVILSVILQLCVSRTTSYSLYYVSSRIIGIIMFFYILLGIASIFNCTRISTKDNGVVKIILTAVIFAAAIGVGVYFFYLLFPGYTDYSSQYKALSGSSSSSSAREIAEKLSQIRQTLIMIGASLLVYVFALVQSVRSLVTNKK